MATWGFRIHTMEPRLRRAHTPLDIADVSEAAPAADACTAVYEAALSLVNVTKLGRPTYFVSEDHEEVAAARDLDDESLPHFILRSVEMTGRVLKFRVLAGVEGDHDDLSSRDGSSEPMSDRAAMRGLFVWMVFPPAGGTAFLLSETRGRTHVGELLLKWITRTAQRESVTIDDRGGRQEGPWLGWAVEPRIHAGRLDNLRHESAQFTVRLRRHTVSSSDQRGGHDIELTQLGLKQSLIDRAFEAIFAMQARRGKDSERIRRERAAKDVVELLDEPVGGIDFTDGEISFKEKGKTQTVNAETVDRLFVYPLGEGKPRSDEVFVEGMKIIGVLANALDVKLT